MQAENIRINGMYRPVGISGKRIRVTWNDKGEGRQSAFQVITKNAADGSILSDSGKTTGSSLSCVLLQSTAWQTRVEVTVRLWDDKDQAEEPDPAETAFYETAMAPQDFTAKWISPEEKDPDGKTPHLPAGYLRKRFQLPQKLSKDPSLCQLSEAARLYATAHGLYVIWINGHRVGDAVLAPGTAEYEKRQPYQTYDVTALLQPGENEIVAALGDGWYRSDSGVHGDRFVYGHDLSLLAQLVVNGKTCLITDGTWEAGAGPILQNDMQQGETFDARIRPFQSEPLQSVHAAREEEFPMDTLIPSDSVPVREHERFTVWWDKDAEPLKEQEERSVTKADKADKEDKEALPSSSGFDQTSSRQEDFVQDEDSAQNAVPGTVHGGGQKAGKVLHTPDDSVVLDFGQNLAGYIQLHIPNGRAGCRISLVCGESLDENGNFTNRNFQEDPKHEGGGIRQTITYICKDGENDYKPSFTIMGFRYAKLEIDDSEVSGISLENNRFAGGSAGSYVNDGKYEKYEKYLSGSTFTAIAVYSDIKQTATFHSSNEDLNQLFSNSIWSMKSNFCDVPTDCPTRERAGWTGDAGLFAPFGLQMMDTAVVFRKWLAECRACQYPDGKIANIAPKTGKPTMFTPMLAASVGWGDACILVPLALYRWTGDPEDLARNYDMMKRWYAFLEKRAAQTPPEKLLQQAAHLQADPLEKYVIDTGLDYGEWCEPGSSAKEDMGHPNRAVSTGYFAYSGRLLSRIATILGRQEDAVYYRGIAEKAKQAYVQNFTENGVVNSTRQADYIRAIRFDLVPEDKKKLNADKLNQNVKGNNYHLNTGFLSTPYLCSTLADYGYVDTAYKVLLQDTAPSWLYAVKKGATTIWERWDGIDQDNKVHASLNHYSYGAISGWLLSGVCGIHVADGRITIRPVIPGAGDGSTSELTFAQAAIDTYVGHVRAGWRKTPEGWAIYGHIPDGQEAQLILPDGSTKDLAAGEFSCRYLV